MYLTVFVSRFLFSASFYSLVMSDAVSYFGPFPSPILVSISSSFFTFACHFFRLDSFTPSVLCAPHFLWHLFFFHVLNPFLQPLLLRQPRLRHHRHLRGLAFTSLRSPVSIFCDPSLALSRHRGPERGVLSLPGAESLGGPVRSKVLQGEPSPSGIRSLRSAAISPLCETAWWVEENWQVHFSPLCFSHLSFRSSPAI